MTAIVKAIRLTVPEAKAQAFLACQAQWNVAMAEQPGFRSARVLRRQTAPTEFWVLVEWDTSEALERFMASVHDDLFVSTGIDATYDAIDVQLHDVLART